MPDSQKTSSYLVWDIPTRLFHWLLVATLVFQYASAEWFDDMIQWHSYGGYFCLGLIIFRVLWGIIGSHYARFSQFVVSPKSVAKYLMNNKYKTESKHESLGHNPLGAYSVIAMLSIILTQALSGLFISDNIFTDGPYYGVLSDKWQNIVEFIHRNTFNLIIAFVVLHLAAIIFYKLVKKQALVAAMFNGKKTLIGENIDSKLPVIRNRWWLFFVSAGIAALAVYLLVVVFAPEQAVDDWVF